MAVPQHQPRHSPAVAPARPAEPSAPPAIAPARPAEPSAHPAVAPARPAEPSAPPAEAPDHPAETPGRHLKAASLNRPRLMPTLGWAAVIAVVIAVFALGLFQSVIVDRQATLDELNSELEEVRAMNDKLRLNVARAEAPERVVAQAVIRLGMVEPDQRIYLAPVELDEGR